MVPHHLNMSQLGLRIFGKRAITFKISRIPTEDIDSICSLESGLSFSSISSVRILSILEVIASFTKTAKCSILIQAPNQPRPVTMSMISLGSSNSTQEIQSSDGELWEACRIGDLERVKDLLSGRGSSINARDISGRRNRGNNF